jgi:hypothetical protein
MRTVASRTLGPTPFTPAEIALHGGEYAVLVDGAVESFHPSNREALAAACARHLAGAFSVLRVEAPALAKRAARGA